MFQKSFSLIIVGVLIGIILLTDNKIIDFFQKEIRQYKSPIVKNRYGDYDPGKDKKFSKEERDYFNKIAKYSEFEGKTSISRWTSDMQIYVKGEKPAYLMEELERIINELNEIIDPITIRIVNQEKNSNYQIIFDSQEKYNQFAPRSRKFTQKNWGLFLINYSGKVITNGSMYVDIYRCTNTNGQKHLLREELTQSLGLTNDSYTYPESIFQQKWTETTEYAPIDRKLIDMLYNHW